MHYFTKYYKSYIYMSQIMHVAMEVPLLFRHDARSNVHGLQFLKQQLARIRNFHISKLRAILAHVAAMYAHLIIHCSNHAAALAHVHLVLVRRIIHASTRESARPVRHHAITLHFTKSVPTITAAPLRWLPSQIHHRPNGPAVLLVVHHVLQPLVECGTDEHAGLNLLSRQTIVHELVAVALVTQLQQLSPNGFNVQLAKGRAVSEQAQLH